MKSKYETFREHLPVSERSRIAPYTINTYVAIECPHCNSVFVKITQQQLKNSKASKCLKHLRVCPKFVPPPSTEASGEMPPPAEARPAKEARTDAKFAGEDQRLVTIYGLVLVPEGRVVYTGRTNDPDRRLAQHARRSSQCRLVRNAFKKHGRKSFRLDVLMRCRAADAKANEAAWILKNGTLYPCGYNLTHGATAGEELDLAKQLVPAFAGVVPFEGEEEAVEAISESWVDLAQVLAEGKVAEEQREEAEQREAEKREAAKRAVDGAFRSVLRETHPDRAGAERSFTANEVAALLNAARAKFT
jgi:hypothetical protein